jgi:LPS sulfotransferase NodH
LHYEEKEVKPYKAHELNALFQAGDDEEKLWKSYFLNTGCHEQEVANTELSKAGYFPHYYSYY